MAGNRAKIYINLNAGDDVSGNGSLDSPYRSLTNALAVTSDRGDNIDFIVTSDEAEIYDCQFYEKPIRIENRNNIGIIFLAKNVNSRFVWMPDVSELEDFDASTPKALTALTTLNPTYERSMLSVINCQDFTLDGATFSLTPDPNATYTQDEFESYEPVHGRISHAVVLDNSTAVLTNTRIKDWNPGRSSQIIYGRGCIKLEINSLTVGGQYVVSKPGQEDMLVRGFTINNDAEVSAIYLTGTTHCNIYNSYISYLNVCGGTFHGVCADTIKGRLIIDGLLVHDVRGDLPRAARGVSIISKLDNTTPEYQIKNSQFSTIGVGVYLRNLIRAATLSGTMIKNCTFYKCVEGVTADKTYALVYAISCYGASDAGDSYGVSSNVGSELKVMNAIITNCSYALRATAAGKLTASFSVWYDCGNLSFSDMSSKVTALQYIRCVNPNYEQIEADPWGYFYLGDNSPCIDSGSQFGDPYSGNAPDIGAVDRAPAYERASLTSLLSRQGRYYEAASFTDIDIDNYICQGLTDYDQNIQAGREGSAIRDLMVKPLTGLLEPFAASIENMAKSLNFNNINNMTDREVDALVSNIFVSRRSGTRATGIVRLYLEEASDMELPAETSFVSADGYTYYSVHAMSISRAEMSLNMENSLYYVDILTEARDVGSEYNLPPGSVTKSTGSLPSNVLNIINPSAFEGGTDSETNEELSKRASEAITIRNLVTDRGIRYVLPEEFSNIIDITNIGHGDPEMTRDEIFGYHIGGKVDIYVKIRPEATSKIIEAAPRIIEVNAGTFGSPVLRITSIDILDPLSYEETGAQIPSTQYSLTGGNPDTRFSAYEVLKLRLSKEYVGATLRVNYEWVPEIQVIQDWVNAKSNRVVCADIRVKSMLPSYINFDIAYYGPREIEGLDQILSAYLSLGKGRITASSLISYVHSLGATQVINPFTLELKKVSGVTGNINTDLTVRSQDFVDPGLLSGVWGGEITVTYLGTGL